MTMRMDQASVSKLLREKFSAIKPIDDEDWYEPREDRMDFGPMVLRSTGYFGEIRTFEGYPNREGLCVKISKVRYDDTHSILKDVSFCVHNNEAGALIRANEASIAGVVSLVARTDWDQSPALVLTFHGDMTISKAVDDPSVALTDDQKNDIIGQLIRTAVDLNRVGVANNGIKACNVMLQREEDADDLIQTAVDLSRVGVANNNITACNVMLQREEDDGGVSYRTTLMDFGLATVLSDDGTSTPPVAGTPEYTDPQVIVASWARDNNVEIPSGGKVKGIHTDMFGIMKLAAIMYDDIDFYPLGIGYHSRCFPPRDKELFDLLKKAGSNIEGQRLNAEQIMDTGFMQRWKESSRYASASNAAAAAVPESLGTRRLPDAHQDDSAYPLYDEWVKGTSHGPRGNSVSAVGNGGGGGALGLLGAMAAEAVQATDPASPAASAGAAASESAAAGESRGGVVERNGDDFVPRGRGGGWVSDNGADVNGAPAAAATAAGAVGAASSPMVSLPGPRELERRLAQAASYRRGGASSAGGGARQNTSRAAVAARAAGSAFLAGPGAGADNRAGAPRMRVFSGDERYPGQSLPLRRNMGWGLGMGASIAGALPAAGAVSTGALENRHISPESFVQQQQQQQQQQQLFQAASGGGGAGNGSVSESNADEDRFVEADLRGVSWPRSIASRMERVAAAEAAEGEAGQSNAGAAAQGPAVSAGTGAAAVPAGSVSAAAAAAVTASGAAGTGGLGKRRREEQENDGGQGSRRHGGGGEGSGARSDISAAGESAAAAPAPTKRAKRASTKRKTAESVRAKRARDATGKGPDTRSKPGSTRKGASTESSSAAGGASSKRSRNTVGTGSETRNVAIATRKRVAQAPGAAGGDASSKRSRRR